METKKTEKLFANPKTLVDGGELPDDLGNTFHHSIWPFVLIAQLMGVLPVSGVREKDVTRVQFKWIYAGVPVTMVLIGFVTTDLFLSLKIVFERGLKMYTVGSVTFNLACLLALIVFFDLARHWPDLIRQLTETERIFLRKCYETNESKVFCFRLRFYGAVLLLGAVVEHSVYKASAIYNNYRQIKICNLTVSLWENFFMRERLHIFSMIEFHNWMIPLSEWITISMTFMWNFIDIFLLLITSCLALRFDQVNKSIRRSTSMPMADEFWMRSRNEFMALVDLLQAVDAHLAGLVLLSCANNSYFICSHVFQSFQQRGNAVETGYFWFSLCLVLTRILTSMIATASINDRANDILVAFYEIPIDYWGVELERFYEIVASDLISISGKGFFFITRRLIFAMAGTVVTYELVLFDQVKDVVDRIDFCTSKRL